MIAIALYRTAVVRSCSQQKKEQEETGQTWKQWCEEQKVHQVNFPGYVNFNQYALIARYPGACHYRL
jgi:hypothetical protein